MSTILALPGIVEYFVATTGCTADEARYYLAEFSDIIGDSMHKGESVEIAGIGTFKRIGAGEGAEVAFEPSETLTEAVNAPFAMFDPVELDDEVTEDITSKDDVAESTAAAGSTTFDQGTDDLNVVREHKEEIIVEEKKPVVAKEEVFTAVEQMPQFPGGEGELLKYLGSHINYPPMAAENNIQGRVVVKFVVKKDGNVGEVIVLRGKDPDLDKEAVRVVKSLPKFIPGKMNGQPVAVWYTVPVNFKLQMM